MSKEHVVDETGERSVTDELAPDERSVLEDAGVDPAAVVAKDHSYRTLLDAGVEESVANDLRRRFSLPWSFQTDGDLDERSTTVSGLGSAEREWVAASADDEWQTFEAARERAAAEEDDGDDERPWPKPTPAESVTGVGPQDADRLADGGITSAERLATVDALAVANALDLDVLHVRAWRHNARELLAGLDTPDVE